MFARSLVLVALASLASIGVAMPADICCECGAPCAPAVVVKAPAPHYVRPFYIVDQGPVYGGPPHGPYKHWQHHRHPYGYHR